MLEHIFNLLGSFNLLDVFVIALNIALFLFSGILLNRIQGAAGSTKRPRMLTMRSLSFMLLIMYLIAFIPGVTFGLKDCQADNCNPHIIKQLSETGATLVVSYILMLLTHLLVIKRFGREREVQGELIHYETYQSRLVSIVVLVTVITFLLLTTLTIWGLEGWLRQTSVLGGLAVLIFFTKDLWLPDNINGLILLYKTDVVPGSVVRVRKLDLLAITLRTSLIETAFRDLVHGQRIIIPNSMFRNQVIEVINHDDTIKDFVEFNIGYAAEMENIKAFLAQAHKDACEIESGIDPQSEARINVVTTGDHAVTWRLTYSLNNPYRLRKAQMAISEAALACSAGFGIGLNTPVTHRILDANLHPPEVVKTSLSSGEQNTDK
ncbi:MAG: mechanosensitive ion channel family protein [Xanthomonadales bacterium]|nr:mechanosensitive ion channel family protein [Xanthomonadales bacterium]